MSMDARLTALVEPMQARLRAFAFGAELDELGAALLRLLAGHRTRRADVEDRLRLKALGLAADYLDAKGRAAEAAALLAPTVAELLASSGGWGAELAGATDLEAQRRLLRQRVWCCAAYALARLRRHELGEAGRVLARLDEFVEGELAVAEFPCYGTKALVRYYRGLVRRNTGDLNAAAWDFDAALEQTRLRLEEKRRRYQTANPERYRRELIYGRVMTARVLGFGHGGIALSRGRYVEARGWLEAAQQMLAQWGQETWRNSLEVYARAAGVLVVELRRENDGMLAEQAARLEELAGWFRDRNAQHAFLAEAFGLLAAVRRRQLISRGTLDLTGLRRRLEGCLRAAGREGGPLATSAAVELVACLLRAGEGERAEVEMAKRQGEGEGELEWALLRAERWLETGRGEAARALLTEKIGNRAGGKAWRARAWGLLALVEHRAGQRVAAERAVAGVRECRESVQEGWTRAFLDDVVREVGRPSAVAGPMPYQQPEEDARWFDLDHNLETARLRVVEQAHARYPDYNVERLAAVVGRGSSWLYAFLGRHREESWAKRIMGYSNAVE